MRLDSLRLQNFRGYEDREFIFHPNFNLIVGENGVGKTSLLEAAAVAIGSWFLGIRGHDSRTIRPKDVRVERQLVERRYRELFQYPVRVAATGSICFGRGKRSSESDEIEIKRYEWQPLSWARSVEGEGGRTTQQEAKELKVVAEGMARAIIEQEPVILPLIRYFGAGRLWESVRDSDNKSMSRHKTKQLSDLATTKKLTKEEIEFRKLSEPFFGYRFSVDKRCNPDDLIRWMGHERRAEIDDEQESHALRLVNRTIRKMLPNARTVKYSVRLKKLIISFSDGRMLSFDELSDGYRNIAAMAADLAIKAAMLNPHLAEKALHHTPGVVLIDELDLHLHPKWQRQVIEAFRKTFPKLQFICTTHSPFLIQSLRSGEELIVLDGQPTAMVNNMTLEEISEGLMGVENAEVGERYAEMRNTARRYLEQLESKNIPPEAKLEDFKKRLAKSIAPYADNPAFQAFLELKRVAKLGE